MRAKHLFYGLALLTAPALAQEAEPAPAAEAVPQAETAEARFQQLESKVEAAFEAWIEKVQAMVAEAEAAGEELTEYPDPPHAEFIPQFMEAADDYAGTEQAVPFLVWVVQNGLFMGGEEGKQALERIETAHIASPALEGFAPMLPQLGYVLGPDRGKKLAAKLEQKNPSVVVKAWAVYTRLQQALTQSPIDSDEYREAKQEMMAALAPVESKEMIDMISGEFMVREEFAIGSVAPDIAGPDLDGKDFKLSDYKGKVIFLDFWGDW